VLNLEKQKCIQLP